MTDVRILHLVLRLSKRGIQFQKPSSVGLCGLILSGPLFGKDVGFYACVLSFFGLGLEDGHVPTPGLYYRSCSSPRDFLEGPEYGPLPSVKGSDVWARVLELACNSALSWASEGSE